MKSFTFRTLSLAIGLGFLISSVGTMFVGTPTASARSLRYCSAIPVAAHRGVSQDNGNENTIASFKAAVQRGAKTIESDLRLTKDGYWVLMHDATVDRTTRSKGLIANKTLDQVKRMRTTTGRAVPTYAYLKREMPKSLGYQLEIKPSLRASDEQLQYLIDSMQKTTPANKVFFTSSNPAMLKRMAGLRKDDYRFTLGLIMKQNDRWPASKIPAYVDSINVIDTRVSADYIRSVHARGKKVLARSADNPAEWRRLVGAGVDRLVTDEIGGYVSWCRGVRR